MGPSERNHQIVGYILKFAVLVFLSAAIFSASAYSQQSRNSNPSPKVVLALKYIEFQYDGDSLLKESGVSQLVEEINSIYSQCAIQFKLDDYKVLDPQSLGLPAIPQSTKEMWTLREPFDDSRYLVVIKTGRWNHEKVGGPNAWTAMPGETPMGVVLESSVGTFAGILAHELGHYLNLHHLESPTNLMNPTIYQDSTVLTPTQCSQMRGTVSSVYRAATRTLSQNSI